MNKNADKVRSHAVILAAGTGERFNDQTPKQFVKIAGKSIIEHTIMAFERNEKIDSIKIVVDAAWRSKIEDILLSNSFLKVDKVLNGGKTRRESSYIGINSISDENDNILIHDAARPLLSQRIISDCVSACNTHRAVDVAIPCSDTIIKTDENGFIESIPKRSELMRGQTPQAFKVSIIKTAHQMALDEKFDDVTDDCALVLRYNLSKVFIVNGDEQNIKVTYPEDVYITDKLFQLKTIKSPHAEIENIKGKVIVIFGSSKGIGNEIEKLALSHGAKVYGFSRSYNNLDIVNYDDVKNALEKVNDIEGQIDAVINTAGVLRMGKLGLRSSEDILDEININYIGTINVTKASMKYLSKSNGSILLFTSSSYTRGRALYSIYSSTKAAIVNFVQAIAEEGEVDGIRINAINPERTATPMRVENFGYEPKDSLLDPVVVAEASIKTLLSDENGQVINVKIK